LIAQQEQRAAVRGTIIDSETGHPLDNAIVFLANTPIGTSSANDGTFRIAYVPVGDYQMVISRVGYSREVINLDVAKPESLYYEIKLKPQPVRTAGVEVYGERPAELKPNPTLFLPKESPGTYCIYGAANTLPVGIFFSDSAFYMYSLDTAIIDSEKYVRIWLLYQNLSQTPYDLDPQRYVRLHMKGKKYSYKSLIADQPSEIHEKVKNEDATKMVSSTIGKELQAGAEKDRMIKGGILKFLLGNTAPDRVDPFRTKFEVIRELSKATGKTSGGTLFQIYSLSQNDGVLQRHLVYPNNGVHGYVYFPFPGLNWKATASGFPEAVEYVYTIEIVTQNGSKDIEFEPH
jgi:hypothetical protein